MQRSVAVFVGNVQTAAFSHEQLHVNRHEFFKMQHVINSYSFGTTEITVALIPKQCSDDSFNKYDMTYDIK